MFDLKSGCARTRTARCRNGPCSERAIDVVVLRKMMKRGHDVESAPPSATAVSLTIRTSAKAAPATTDCNVINTPHRLARAAIAFYVAQFGHLMAASNNRPMGARNTQASSKRVLCVDGGTVIIFPQCLRGFLFGANKMSCPDCAKRMPTHRHVWSKS